MSSAAFDATVPDISAQLSKLPKAAQVDLQGLVNCATSHLAERTAEGKVDPRCLSVSYLGSGSYNHVYGLEFSDGTKFAASVTKQKKKLFSAEAKLSEIATMKYVRDSGLYPDVPVPEVHAWDTTFNNPVGAPYVLMDFVPGVVIDNKRVEPCNPCLLAFDASPEEKQLAIVKALAGVAAALSKAVPFSKLGSIVFADATLTSGTCGTEPFSTGPLMTFDQTSDE